MHIYGRQQYRLVGPEFMGAAPDGYTGETTVPVPAAEAFRLLVESDWSDWYPGVREAGWTSEPPHGEGSRFGLYRRNMPPYESSVVVWQPGRHLFLSMTRGGSLEFAAGAEEFMFQPLSETSCHLRWRVVYETRGVASILSRLLRPLAKAHPVPRAVARRVPRQFAKYAASRAG